MINVIIFSSRQTTDVRQNTGRKERNRPIGVLRTTEKRKGGEGETVKNCDKYAKQYFLPKEPCFDWAKKDAPDKAPLWCSVDLRDGNQALVEPMDLHTKIEFFRLLTELGFKEIEVGFPASSGTEYAFVRELIERELIPSNVTIQVLTQARESIIRRTFESVRGAKNVIVHVYNPVSPVQREQVFGGGRAEVKRIAEEGATIVGELAAREKGNFRLEYSPESFTSTEPEFASEVCNAVLEIWKPSAEKKAIVNLPATVETSMPHVFASQVEYLRKHLIYPEATVLSLHPHNDRGCGVAAAEAGLLAGAQRVEGTLFGNGERTGNVDLVTLALNLYSHGIDPQLNFENLPYVAAMYTFFTGMKVPPRQPYAGKLVFAAFAGAHQDAISKSLKFRSEEGDGEIWNVPYLPIDPTDVGREYDKDVIRINSQSGKGGVGYVLENAYEIHLPPKLRADLSEIVKKVSDEKRKELQPSELYRIFVEEFVENGKFFAVSEIRFSMNKGIDVKIVVEDKRTGERREAEAHGNGRLDAASNALKKCLGVQYTMSGYEQSALSPGSSAQALTYLCITADGRDYWGAGIHDDSTTASVNALCAAINNLFAFSAKNEGKA